MRRGSASKGSSRLRWQLSANQRVETILCFATPLLPNPKYIRFFQMRFAGSHLRFQFHFLGGLGLNQAHLQAP